VATSDPIELATEIMAAFVANNAVPRADLPALFEGLHSALKRLADGGEVAPAAIDPPAPAVSIRKSVTPDYLICLEDGKRFKSLRGHLTTLGMTPDQYRVKWKLPSDYPMVAPNYAAQRSALAKKIGFGLREKPIAATPPPSPGKIEAATVPPVSADPIDAAAHNAAGVAASRAKTKRKVAVPPEATAKRKSGRARKATA
jgi:predicted transcriptional regulator